MHQNGIDMDNFIQLHTATHCQHFVFQPLLEHLMTFFPNYFTTKTPGLPSCQPPLSLPFAAQPFKTFFFPVFCCGSPLLPEIDFCIRKNGLVYVAISKIPKSQQLNICIGSFHAQLSVYSVVKDAQLILAIQGKCMTRALARHNLLKLLLEKKEFPSMFLNDY